MRRIQAAGERKFDKLIDEHEWDSYVKYGVNILKIWKLWRIWWQYGGTRRG